MCPSRSEPKLLLLDAMGTLLSLSAPAPELCRQLQQRFGMAVDEHDARHALAAEIAYYRAHLQDGRTPETLADLRRRCAAILRAALPPSAALQAVDEADLTQALLAALRFDAFDDVVPALRRARSRGQRMIVVSNWDCSLGTVLEHAGLAPWLDAVVTSAEVGAAKPSPVIFERALALAGCSAAQALHVGDSVAEDVEGARAAGVAVLLLARDGRAPPPGVRAIASLGEL